MTLRARRAETGVILVALLAGCAHTPRASEPPPPRLVVESPRPGELVRGPELDVRGRVETYDGRAWVHAEGTQADLASAVFIARKVPIWTGPMTLKIVAADGRGQKTQINVPILVESPDRPHSSTLCRPGQGCLRYEERGVPRRDVEGKITNAVVVLSPFGFDERLDELWPDLVGPGRALDTRVRYVIGAAPAPDSTGRRPEPAQIVTLLGELIHDLGLHRGLALVGASSYGAELALRSLALGQTAGPVLLCGGHDRPFEEPTIATVGRTADQVKDRPATEAWTAVARIMVPASYGPGYFAEPKKESQLVAEFAQHFTTSLSIDELRRRTAAAFALKEQPIELSAALGRRIVLVANRDDQLTSISRVRALALRLRRAGAEVSLHELSDPLGHSVFFERVPLELEQAVQVLLR